MAIKIEPEEEFPFERARIDEEQKREKLKVKIDTSNVNLNDLMGRIRHHVLINRIRVCKKKSIYNRSIFSFYLGKRIFRRFRSSSFGYSKSNTIYSCFG